MTAVCQVAPVSLGTRGMKVGYVAILAAKVILTALVVILLLLTYGDEEDTSESDKIEGQPKA